uniref:Insulin like growth factor binding protein 7 n=1 Tax=Capra hircus TaxID=9925 RepID=A0A8C2QXU8_CAPHI
GGGGDGWKEISEDKEPRAPLKEPTERGRGNGGSQGQAEDAGGAGPAGLCPGRAPAQHVTSVPSSGGSWNRRASGVPAGERSWTRAAGDTGVAKDKVHSTKGVGEESISIGYVYPPFLHFFVCVRGRRRGNAGAAAGGPVVSGVCVCKSRYPVCGSDGVTYSSGCQLRAASLRAESRGEKAITQVSKGTCEQGPSIVTPPKDIWNVTGAQVYLSCEVIGIPTPVLIWNKVKRGHYGVQRTELLPGDRDNLAIQTRGGPEKHEVTGWVLVSPLSKEDAGEYECHASNSQGQASASAKITVVDALHEIPVKKGR